MKGVIRCTLPLRCFLSNIDGRVGSDKGSLYQSRSRWALRRRCWALHECRYRRTTKSFPIGDGALAHARTGKTETRKQLCGCDIGISVSR